MQLMLDLRDEIRSSEQHQTGLAPKHHAQQMIEPGEVIHVRMRDEDMRDTHQFSRRKHRNIAEVEQQRSTLIAKIDIQTRVAERIVDETRFKQAAHRSSSRRGAAGRAAVAPSYFVRGLFL